MTERSSSREMERALAEARAALGSPEQVARLRERVAIGVAGGASGVALTHALRAKLGGWTVAGVIAAGGSWLWLHSAAPQASAPATLSTHAAVLAQSAAPAPEAAATALQPATLALGAAAAALQPLAAEPPQHSAAEQAALAQSPQHSAAEHAAPVARVAPRADSQRRRPTSQPSAALRSAAEDASHPSEVELISRAEGLVDRTPAAALELLGTHERLYPHGMLGEERDVLRVDAEWALGRRQVALDHARAFVKQYPSSAQARRLSRLLADHNFEPSATPTE